jgi:hypothetical protein
MISVVPVERGWSVRTEPFAGEMMFRSGARAEAAARSLGRRLASAGAPAEIHIYLRDGSLGGRFVCPPPPAPDLARAG